MEIPTRFVDKAKFVLGIFTDVETEYDFLLQLMSLSFDSVWRRRMLGRIDFLKDANVLDLACGTGLVTFELGRWATEESLIVGLDLSPAMLSIARRNKMKRSHECPLEFVRAAGEFMPLREGLFNYVTVGLALRNFADKPSVFRESLRILRRPGSFLSVDFVRPRNRLVWFFYRFHIFYVLPTLGRIVSSHWKRTLIYLANSILLSVPGPQLCRLLETVGFRCSTVDEMSLGIVALVEAEK